MKTQEQYIVSASPFQHGADSTPKLMWTVVYTLIPVLIVAAYYFGISALLVNLFAVLGCFVAEWLFQGKKPLKDGSALITGILLGLTLPPGFPFWMAFLGGFIAIVMGKTIWGGLGNNIFNPALVGRAFLQAAFPTAITTWSLHGGSFFSLHGTNLALPFLQGQNIDAVSAATPLAKMKFEQEFAPLGDLFYGSIEGSIGETSAIVLLLMAAFLLWKKIINWRIPVGILGTVLVLSMLFWLIDDAKYPTPLHTLLSGGLLLGTVYMATDLVSSPITPKGTWWYAIGIGVLVILIRYWGGLPEGVMYAILLMNAATPLLNRFTKIKPYGYS